VAGYDDLRRAFEQASQRDLGPLFTAWTGRTGAPRIKLSDVVLRDDPPGFRLSGRIDQTQVEAPYPLDVPLLVELSDGQRREEAVRLDQRSARFDIELPVRALRVAADPDFDLFRTLAEGEAPVTLSRLFGAERGIILWPADAPPELAEGYRALAKAWAADHPGWEVRSDRDLAGLPQGMPVWLLGWENRHLATFSTAEERFRLDPPQRRLSIAGQDALPDGPLSPVLTRTIEGQPIAWLGVPDANPLRGLARKLPHYGKYSYLVFTGDAPDVRVKGLWPAGDSELTVWLTRERPQPKRRERPPLTDGANGHLSSSSGTG
jgi:aminopeptidase N